MRLRERLDRFKAKGDPRWRKFRLSVSAWPGIEYQPRAFFTVLIPPGGYAGLVIVLPWRKRRGPGLACFWLHWFVPRPWWDG